MVAINHANDKTHDFNAKYSRLVNKITGESINPLNQLTRFSSILYFRQRLGFYMLIVSLYRIDTIPILNSQICFLVYYFNLAHKTQKDLLDHVEGQVRKL